MATEEGGLPVLSSSESLFYFFVDLPWTIIILLSLVVCGIVTGLFMCLKKVKTKVIGHPPPVKYRFRKRDKIMFYGRKVMRKIRFMERLPLQPQESDDPNAVKSSVSNTVVVQGSSSRTRIKKRQKFVQLVKKILRLRKEGSKPGVQLKEPPPALLEADLTESGESHLPPEVMYMLNSVRVFGHFEKPMFLELCRHMETMSINEGDMLFKVGQPDDSIFVVVQGKLTVYITEKDGTEMQMKEVLAGDSVHSLLSILDVITGYPAPYKTVSCRALEKSTILRLPANALQTVFKKYPESLVRVVQIIMVRLQRVTFMALHNYLGLTTQLMNKSLHHHHHHHHHHPSHTMGQPKSPKKLASTTSVGSSTEKVIRSVNFEDAPPSWSDSEQISAKTSRPSRATSQSDVPVKERRRRAMSLGSALQPALPLTSSNTEGARISRLASVRGMSVDSEGSGAESGPSDFDTACDRARVGQGVVGTPPVARRHSGDYRRRLDYFVEHHSSSSTRTSPVFKDNRLRHTSHDDSFLHRAAFFETQESTDSAVLSKYQQWTEDDEVLDAATEDLAKLFGLDEETLLRGRLTLEHYRAGQYLVHQGDQDSSLFFVATGTLLVCQKTVDTEEEETVLIVSHSGELVGVLAALTGEPSFFSVKAKHDSRVVAITKSNFYSIMRDCPHVVLNVAHAFVSRMSPFVRQIDFALDWMLIDAGRALYRQGDPSDSTYVVLNGRLRSVHTLANGRKQLMGEYGRGEIVGVVETLTQSPRASTVHAIRDTELAKMPAGLLDTIKRKHPQVVTRLIHLLGQRILGHMQQRPQAPLLDIPAGILNPAYLPRQQSWDAPSVACHMANANLTTVALLPASEDVPLTTFSLDMYHSLTAIGSTLRLTSDIIKTRLGIAAFDSVQEFRLSSWLGQQEDIHRIVLYQADPRMTAWTQRCIRQADCILIVALGDKEPTVSELENQMDAMAVRAQKELVLLHKEDVVSPIGTADWLNARSWISSHHHISCPKRIFTRKNPKKVMEMYEKMFEKDPDRHSDFARLARFLTGTSVALVLGGGGARGAAHIGVMRILQEQGIPVDIIGGTSIGALMGALWAEERNWRAVADRARSFFSNMTSLWKKLVDLTYPVTSMFSGGAFNKGIEGVFGDKQIEDLWIPYFNITTDVSASKMRIHTDGDVWRYVRASMTFHPYLPPMCDTRDGHLLVDGCYVNNLPADVAKSMGANFVIAVDVGSQDDRNLTHYGDYLSGWWVLYKKWNPFTEKIRVLDMSEIQQRLAYVSCMKQMEEVKCCDYVEYVRPPIDRYKTLQFGSFDEIMEVGYAHAVPIFTDWRRADEVFGVRPPVEEQARHPLTGIQSNAYFTDLAELVSRIPQQISQREATISDDEYSSEYEDEEDADSGLVVSTSVPNLAEASDEPKKREAISEGGTPTDEGNFSFLSCQQNNLGTLETELRQRHSHAELRESAEEEET
ncbi:patatin-like phospholipase domain-containing protein 7 isoform X17 [Branchiostoma floridae x Branchiostoma japonicum]